jgi:hypothetical protein
MNLKQALLQQTLNLYLNTPLPGLSKGTRARFNSLAEYLLQPTVNPKALGLTYATIKYWEEKGYLLIPTLKDTDEWRKYSVIEYLWFQLLKKVVDMGCNLDKVAPRLIFGYANFKKPDSTIYYTDEQTPVMVINGIRVNPLNNFLNHTILTVMLRSKSALNINDEACQFYFLRGDRVAIANEAYNSIFTTGINISISNILFTTILGMDDNAQNKIQIFNDQEAEVIKLISKSDINQITIKLDEGKIYELHAVEKFSVTDLHKYLSNYVTADYQELLFKTNNNKSLALTRTTKQNFKH